jgi:Spy/CpxP family protein refolding chaperone
MVKNVKVMAAAAALTVAVTVSSQAQDDSKKVRPGAVLPGQGREVVIMKGGFGGGSSVYFMISRSVILQTELKVTDDQKQKLEEVGMAQREIIAQAMEGIQLGRDTTEEQAKEMTEKLENLRAQSKKAFAEVLDKDQAKRADQIGLQMEGVQAFGSKVIQDGLKMTDEQKGKVKAVMDQYQKDVQELHGVRDGVRGGIAGRRPSGEDLMTTIENQRKIAAMGKEAEEKIVGAMTDEQKKAWKEMVGETFDTSKLRQGFGGRPHQDG